ncbi:hypothetical protein Csa_012893 [Cucumis sativus]|uniref:Uncharacterized protein n=1 Tax=Cucumis sativus TaxID=3659 RepID=A0A0A0KYN5_CUCSA|nr:hypothetical protein Csa_012893 [Cucumis sativus]
MASLCATVSVQLFLICSGLLAPMMLGLLMFGPSPPLLDSWIRTIDPSSTFTVKSLMDDLVGSIDFHVKEFYSAI